MAGEMIAMLHGLGGGRRYGLGDVMANADQAFAQLDNAIATAQGVTAGMDPTAGLNAGRYAMNTFGGSAAGVTVQRNMPLFNKVTGKFETSKVTMGPSASAIPGYTPPGTSTDWSVYALPVGILLAAAGVAWYLTREKAL